jgi:hypothetical protein
MRKFLNVLPTVSDYTNYLNKVVNKFNISINEARNRYGKLTYKQWNNLLNN